MSSPAPRSSKPTRLSPFFRDLASPISHHHRPAGRFATSGQAAAVSALWRESLAGSSASSDPPPPPAFTLDDRADFSPEAGLGELPPPSPVSPTGAWSRTPPTPPDQKGPFSPSPSLSSSSCVLRTRAEVNTSGAAYGGGKSPEGSIWMTSPKVDGGEREKMDRGSPVDGVVEPGALMELPPPPPREIARPELRQGYGVQNGGLDADVWVTVFGFSPGDTNLVLREFEKFGVIVKHVPGPRDANWIHILYQNAYDAQKALKRSGVQLNSSLIIGVKPVDPVHRLLLKETQNKINHGGFMVSLPSKSAALNGSVTATSLGSLARSYHPKTSSNFTTDNGHRATGSVAIPAKSVVSKVMDLLFGI